MKQVRIPGRILVEARAFAEKVYRYRTGNSDKFLQGDELRADIRGFEVEFAHNYAFNQPFPKIFDGKKVDDFDSWLAVPNENGLLQALKFDVKRSKDLLINKEQFRRKKVDAFVFEDLNCQQFKTDMLFLEIYGWILRKDVVKNSELVRFENNQSEAYNVKRRALKSAEQLFGLTTPGGI